MKIQASELLLEHTEDTFTTPVFNGSASLRDAAGQMIESVAKSVRRRQEVNDEYLVNLYDEVKALYHLDQGNQGGAAAGGKADLGPLPGTAVLLLGSLAAAWVLILLYLLFGRRRDRR